MPYVPTDDFENLTTAEQDAAVLRAFKRAGPMNFADVRDEIDGGRMASYRPIDRALQRLRKAGRIKLAGRIWIVAQQRRR